MLARPAPVIRRTAPGCCSAAAAPEPANITATQMIVMGFNHLQCYFWVSGISHPWGQGSHLHPLSQNTDFCTVDGNSAPFSVEPAAISTDRCQVHVFTEQAPICEQIFQSITNTTDELYKYGTNAIVASITLCEYCVIATFRIVKKGMLQQPFGL